MNLSERLFQIRQDLVFARKSVRDALVETIDAILDDIARRDREEREAAARSVGG